MYLSGWSVLFAVCEWNQRTRYGSSATFDVSELVRYARAVFQLSRCCCYYCHQHEETKTHLFWQCDKIQQFLKELILWLKSNNIKCDISEEYFILGLMKNNISEILRFILLYAKYYIYITRCNQQNIIKCI